MDRPVKRRINKALVVLLGAVMIGGTSLATACNGDDLATNTSMTNPGTSNGTSTSGSGTALEPTGAGADAGASQAVTFNTEDGVALSGHLYGGGTKGVILCHMYPADQTSWYPIAERLAEHGYLVLTFDFRGYGESGGDKEIEKIDQDVAAAFFHIRNAGATDVVLVGASMGGTAGLIAASNLMTISSVRLAGVVTLSAPVEFEGLSATGAVPTLVGLPLLFIAAEGDAGADGARELQELAGDQGDLEILPGSEHGTDLLEGSQAETVWSLLLNFLQQNLEWGEL
jgi:alpha/beta superfamily hydrolase